MTSRNRAEQLERVVSEMVENYGLSLFQQYWELCKLTAPVSEVKRFFVRVESVFPKGGYCNAAIISDSLLIDIEGDDRDSSGSLSVGALESLTAVHVHLGYLQGLQDSLGASLVVLAETGGEADSGYHWVAKSEEEAEHLLSFAKALVQTITPATAE